MKLTEFCKKRQGTVLRPGPAMLLAFSLISLGACTPPAEDGVEIEENPQSTKQEEAAPVKGEVPPALLEKIIGDLSSEENLDQESITVVRAEFAIWPDGSLGCPRPGETYTMAQVEGYWVVLQSAGKKYDYRVTSSGLIHRCRNLFRVQNPVG